MSAPLVLACGALVAELRAVLRQAEFGESIEVHYLPANLHNRPDGIGPALQDLLDLHDPHADRTVLIAYADCGTGGGLDRLLVQRPNARRLPGAHCYEFFAGSELFAALHEAELNTFYLTDFLAKHFDALVWEGLGLDRHPDLLASYFGNYRRLVLLSQTDDPQVTELAHAAADRLRLGFERRHVGLQQFAGSVSVALRPPPLSPPERVD